VKRLLLVALVAGCLPFPNTKPTKLEKHIHNQLAGDAKIVRHGADSSYGDGYEAHRKERMDFRLNSSGDLTRTEFTIPGAALPAAVRAAIGRKHIYEATVVFERGTVTFHVDDDDQEWTVDANGKIIDYMFRGDECDDDEAC
jgi:hypothetical protein